MRVTVHLSAFYDWDPVPKGVVVTEQDIADGKVMPGRDGGYRMRVVKRAAGGTVRECHLTEGFLAQKILEEKADIRKAGRTLTRHQAVAAALADNLLPGHAEVDWITGFEVHDDGPDEALFRATLEPHTQAKHGRRPGRANVPPEHVEEHVAKYLGDWKPHPAEDTAARASNHAALIDHLHAHFGVRR